MHAHAPICSIEERLERGEVVYFPECPFALPEGDDRAFLLDQRLGSGAHKNISLNPHTGKLGGCTFHAASDATHLQRLLHQFAESAAGYLRHTLPRYAAAWERDRISYRPEEESTRKLRWKARNDLLHVDSFPTRPTHGKRILRFFVNVHTSVPRVWITSHPFARLLELYGEAAGLPVPERTWPEWLGSLVPFRPQRSPYDSFMLRFHDYLKANDGFQTSTPKTRWVFPPGSAWMCFTDTCSHAVLSGRCALEHSFFVAPETLALPNESPPVLLAQKTRIDTHRIAA